MPFGRKLADVQVTDLLGGRKVLGRVSETGDLLRAVRGGLPYASLEALTRRLGLELSAVGLRLRFSALGTRGSIETPRPFCVRRRRSFHQKATSSSIRGTLTVASCV